MSSTETSPKRFTPVKDPAPPPRASRRRGRVPAPALNLIALVAGIGLWAWVASLPGSTIARGIIASGGTVRKNCT
ncbi:hypothetical protein AB0M42_31435 [Streptomyces sp. NPDC051784]|uniref:hypothetical protein n=1 Tax=Streptomyces sp. NPDC051784 TaxID=3155805 RepID=UPI0034125F8B